MKIHHRSKTKIKIINSSIKDKAQDTEFVDQGPRSKNRIRLSRTKIKKINSSIKDQDQDTAFGDQGPRSRY